MKKVVQCFEEFLKESRMAVFDPESHHGHWHQLTVRTTLGSQIMAVVEFHPQHLSQEELDGVKSSLVHYFSEGSGKSAMITSLYFHQSRARSIKEEKTLPFEHIHGELHIYEDLLGMKFRISPDSFFQVNTLAAELLYNQIIDWCDIQPNTVVLDICCGTGTIGLCVAKKASKVIGFEMCKQAVEDAKANAQLNGVTNIEFHCGKVEDIINGVMKTVHMSHVVAIVDPPRAGLHKSVIKALRSCSHLQRIVYASCSPKSVKPNFTDLIRKKSKKHHGGSFLPVRAIPVDLFPQTSHCELVVLFERLTPTSIKIPIQSESTSPQTLSETLTITKSPTQSESTNPQALSETLTITQSESTSQVIQSETLTITKIPKQSESTSVLIHH
ncbi:tRNA (uracil-5-)-methyltransferase homolog A-like [Gigantopelta aegis]|uniref:tRNA (uracil-5-)-methyltransferase homolog A-like n=1 Tax=Gigantopelta aegis TaxID=1735272 RepID=UPI001B8884AC|nr:tRNA (uracil-5-)-methyltransferase homolog A-like [Gigantopelta aegis]